MTTIYKISSSDLQIPHAGEVIRIISGLLKIRRI